MVEISSRYVSLEHHRPYANTAGTKPAAWSRTTTITTPQSKEGEKERERERERALALQSLARSPYRAPKF